MKIISKIEDAIIKNAPLYNNSKNNVLLYFIIVYLCQKGDINVYYSEENEEIASEMLFNIFSDNVITRIETYISENLYIDINTLRVLFLEELEANNYIIEGEVNFFGQTKFQLNENGLKFMCNIVNSQNGNGGGGFERQGGIPKIGKPINPGMPPQ